MLASSTSGTELFVSHKATGQDVARLAGVSQSAVSLVLKGRGAPALPDTGNRSPNPIRCGRVRLCPEPRRQKSTAARRTNVITFMTQKLGNPYFAEVAGAALGKRCKGKTWSRFVRNKPPAAPL
jgi:Bacterial regulatory proteins, lacI family